MQCCLWSYYRTNQANLEFAYNIYTVSYQEKGVILYSHLPVLNPEADQRLEELADLLEGLQDQFNELTGQVEDLRHRVARAR